LTDASRSGNLSFMSDRLICTADAAAILDVTPRRVRQLRDKIGAYQYTGGLLLFWEKAVRRFLKNRVDGRRNRKARKK